MLSSLRGSAAEGLLPGPEPTRDLRDLDVLGGASSPWAARKSTYIIIMQSAEQVT